MDTLMPQTSSEISEWVSAAALRIEDKVIAWRRDIHQNPELSYHEKRTAALVASHLTALGYEVKTGVGDTGVVGILKGGKPGGVFEFARRALHSPGEFHGAAFIHYQVSQQVAFGVIEADVMPIRPGEDFPIHQPDIVSRGVFAVVGELDGGAAEMGTVRSRKGALGGAARTQPDMAQGFHAGQVQIAVLEGMGGTGHRRGRGAVRRALAWAKPDQAAGAGSRTDSTRCFTIAPASMPSPRAV